MNIALIGYGKMGRLIEAQALSREHRVVTVVEPFASPDTGFQSSSKAAFFRSIPEAAEAKAFKTVDLAFEYSRPDAALGNIKALAEAGIPAVVGTTGWDAQVEEARQAVIAGNSSLIYAANFSMGVNILYRIAAYAAKLFETLPEYDIGGFEIHHNKKADYPSGTAKTLIEEVLQAQSRKKGVRWDPPEGAMNAETIHFSSIRVGSVPGTHTLMFDSSADSIEITHTARSREGFAVGAVRAGEWLVNCSGPGKGPGEVRRGFFALKDVFDEIL